MTLKERLLAKIKANNNGCWLWQASVTSGGYGRIREAGGKSKTLLAHRVSWELHIGSIPNGLFVLHRCDVRNCVNPEHLFLGSTKDNAVDRETKKRGAIQKGERNGASKLTNDLVLTMRKMRSDGMKYREISEITGFPRTTIVNACLYTWQHI